MGAEEERIMLVDNGEDEWQQLHDVRVSGTVLYYVRLGMSLVDVRLAQAPFEVGNQKPIF